MNKAVARVLILDDEYYLGQMLAQALIQENIDATATTDVDSAIEWLRRKPFDLVISDIYLPGKTGKDLFDYIKEQKIEVPVIFMTGNPNLETAIELLTRGGYDYILKPFMIPDFLKKVKEVIEIHKRKRQEKNLVKDLRELLAGRLSELRIYQDVFESVDDGLLITDVDGNIVKINHGFEKIADMGSNFLLHQHIDILRESILPNFRFKTILEQLKTQHTWNGELIGQRNSRETWYVSITFSPICNEAGQIFAYAAIFKDVTNQRDVEQALIGSLKQMNHAQEAIIFGLASLAEHRDNSTGFHLERIRNYAKILSSKLLEKNLYADEIDYEFIRTIYRTAPLHDIGKVGIPDDILLKKGRLTESEFEIIKSHTDIGYKILDAIRMQYGDMQFLKMGIDITHSHHEKWDGSGYPQGLKENEIPLSAQIIAIADVYDALTTARSYKDAYPHEDAVEIMQQDRGKHFSPVIFDVFIESSEQIKRINNDFSENKNIIDEETIII